MTTFFVGFLVLYLLLVVIGAWRLSHDFATEEGPWGCYGTLRRVIKQWAEVQIDGSAVGKPVERMLYWLYVGMEYPHCISFGVALVVLMVVTSPLAWPLAVWWGIAGGITLLDKLLKRLMMKMGRGAFRSTKVSSV